MTLQSIIDFVRDYGIIGFIALSGIIQITPIKINPYSWIAKKIGNAMNKPLTDKIDKLSKRLDEHINASEVKEAQAVRSRILRFADELRCCQIHSKDMFDAVLIDCDNYEKYCKEHDNFKNSIAEASIKLIKNQYYELLAKGN